MRREWPCAARPGELPAGHELATPEAPRPYRATPDRRRDEPAQSDLVPHGDGRDRALPVPPSHEASSRVGGTVTNVYAPSPTRSRAVRVRCRRGSRAGGTDSPTMDESLPHAGADGYGRSRHDPAGRGQLRATVSWEEVIEATFSALGAGEPLSIEVVAAEAGVARNAVLDHFPTVQRLARAVVDRLVDQWEGELLSLVVEPSTTTARLRAYVVLALNADLGPADLAVIADAGLRRELREQWTRRLDAWLSTAARAGHQGPLAAARLIADGAWLNRALETSTLDALDRAHVLEIALALIEEGERVTTS